MDVTSLYTVIYHRTRVLKLFLKHVKNFYKDNPPIPTHYLEERLRLILKENSFQFNGKQYLQTLVTAMGTSTTILRRTVFKPTVW